MKKNYIFYIVTIVIIVLSLTICKTTEKTSDSQTVNDTKSSQSTEAAKALNEEFLRSTQELGEDNITQDTFLKDKKAILDKIDALAKVMSTRDYPKWLTHLSPQSKTYWQDPKNLADVSSRLPVKGYTLKNLEDYFKMLFIPSRQSSKVDEIRYVSATRVKAVEVRGEQDVVYYLFVKINNNWLLELDTQ